MADDVEEKTEEAEETDAEVSGDSKDEDSGATATA